MSFDRNGLLAALRRQVIAVDVPEIGGTVHVKEMSVRERTEFNKKCFGTDGKATISPQAWALALVATCLCDEAGDPLLSDEDAEVLWDQSELKLAAIARHAERLNGLGPSAVTDAEKNSRPAAKSSSSSTSQKHSA